MLKRRPDIAKAVSVPPADQSPQRLGPRGLMALYINKRVLRYINNKYFINKLVNSTMSLERSGPDTRVTPAKSKEEALQMQTSFARRDEIVFFTEMQQALR